MYVIVFHKIKINRLIGANYVIRVLIKMYLQLNLNEKHIFNANICLICQPYQR